jgi:hypothetical protein
MSSSRNSNFNLFATEATPNLTNTRTDDEIMAALLQVDNDVFLSSSTAKTWEISKGKEEEDTMASLLEVDDKMSSSRNSNFNLFTTEATPNLTNTRTDDEIMAALLQVDDDLSLSSTIANVTFSCKTRKLDLSDATLSDDVIASLKEDKASFCLPAAIISIMLSKI